MWTFLIIRLSVLSIPFNLVPVAFLCGQATDLSHPDAYTTLPVEVELDGLSLNLYRRPQLEVTVEMLRERKEQCVGGCQSVATTTSSKDTVSCSRLITGTMACESLIAIEPWTKSCCTSMISSATRSGDGMTSRSSSRRSHRPRSSLPAGLRSRIGGLYSAPTAMRGAM